MKSSIVVFVCILYCCQGGVTNGGKDAVIDGKNEKLPAVTEYVTEVTSVNNGAKVVPVGPTDVPSNGTTTSTPTPPKPTTPSTPKPPIPPSPKPTDPTTPKPTTSTTSQPTTPTSQPTTPTTPKPTTSEKPTPSTPTTPKPIPSSTTGPVPTTTVIPPSNRGFDGPSFIGGIVLASGLMAIGFVALKFYRARTELNYHTL